MMKLVFKITDGTDPAEAIVGNTNFKDHFPGIHKHMPWPSLKPYIRQATRKYVLPFLCTDIYNDIATKFENGDELDPVQEEFLELLQDAVAYYTIHHAMPTLNGSISDMGIQERSSNDATSAPVAMWRYKNMRWEVCMTADNNMDNLLEFMESQVADGNSYFDLWSDSTCYLDWRSDFFWQTSHLQEHLNIRGSRRAFVTLIPYLKKAEQLFIKPILSTYYPELIANMSGATSNYEDELITLIRRTVAEYALVIGVPKIRLVIEEDGFKIVSSNDGMNMKKEAHDQALSALVSQAKENGKTFRQDLIAYLYDNADEFATWKASDYYVNPDSLVETVRASDDHIGGIML
jgi:hypothetical protein